VPMQGSMELLVCFSVLKRRHPSWGVRRCTIFLNPTVNASLLHLGWPNVTPMCKSAKCRVTTTCRSLANGDQDPVLRLAKP